MSTFLHYVHCKDALLDCSAPGGERCESLTWVDEIVNTSRLRQNGCDFIDDIFKCISVNENVQIFIKISLKFVPKGPIDNIPALVQIMAWHQTDDKPLSEPMMLRLPMHTCVTRPQELQNVRNHPNLWGRIWCGAAWAYRCMGNTHPMISWSWPISLAVCCYKKVDFLPNMHPIARPWGQGMGYLFWIQIIYVPSLLCYMHAISWHWTILSNL